MCDNITKLLVMFSSSFSSVSWQHMPLLGWLLWDCSCTLFRYSLICSFSVCSFMLDLCHNSCQLSDMWSDSFSLTEFCNQNLWLFCWLLWLWNRNMCCCVHSLLWYLLRYHSYFNMLNLWSYITSYFSWFILCLQSRLLWNWHPKMQRYERISNLVCSVPSLIAL